jgi:hypothetical protein
VVLLLLCDFSVFIVSKAFGARAKNSVSARVYENTEHPSEHPDIPRLLL